MRTRTFCELFCENWIWLVSKESDTRPTLVMTQPFHLLQQSFDNRHTNVQQDWGGDTENVSTAYSQVSSSKWKTFWEFQHSKCLLGSENKTFSQEVSWKIDCYIRTKLTWNILPLLSLLISTSSGIIYNMVCCYLKSYGLNIVCLICKGSPQPSHISGILNELKNQCHMLLNHFIKRTMSSLTPGFHSTLYCSNKMATQIRECRKGQFHPHFSTVEFKLQNTYPKVKTKCFIYLHYSSRNHPKDCQS